MFCAKESLKSLGEFGLIARIAAKAFIDRTVIKGIGDDTAVLPWTNNKYLLFTTDMLCEGVHFYPRDNGRMIGHKVLACSVSDIAAMGGTPTAAVISIGLPKSICLRRVDDIYRGINTLARRFHLSIVGGDTIQSPRLIINVALLGEAKKGDLVLRSGAKTGDQIFVTGPLGRSLETKKHLSFTPRLNEASYLVSHFKPSAMIDISDGLGADLGHILKQSNKGAILDEAAIPRTKGAALQNALCDGEDFELLFTLPKVQAAKLSRQKKFRVFHIGEITSPRSGLCLRDRKGRLQVIATKGYRHF